MRAKYIAGDLRLQQTGETLPGGGSAHPGQEPIAGSEGQSPAGPVLYVATYRALRRLVDQGGGSLALGLADGTRNSYFADAAVAALYPDCQVNIATAGNGESVCLIDWLGLES